MRESSLVLAGSGTMRSMRRLGGVCNRGKKCIPLGGASGKLIPWTPGCTIGKSFGEHFRNPEVAWKSFQ